MQTNEEVERPAGIAFLGILILVASAVLGIAGLLGIFASPLGLIPGSGLNGAALFTGGVLFLVLGAVLAVAGSGLMRLRRWAWWLAALTTLAVIVWTLWRIFQAIQVIHLEWYATVLIAAVLLGYLATVHPYFRRFTPE